MNKLISEYISSRKYRNVSINPNHLDRVAVIIETRYCPHLKWVIDNIRYHSGWKVTLFHYDNDVSDIDCNKIRLSEDIKDVHQYSDLLKTVKFWNMIDSENILIFQSDSFMLRSGLDEYLIYDYVGSPWSWANDASFKDSRYKDLSIFRFGGNGGFSLRKKSVMIDIIKKYYSTPSREDAFIHEDMFFSKYICNYNYCGLEDSMKFGVETIYYDDPIGVHSIDKYMSESQIRKILFK